MIINRLLCKLFSHKLVVIDSFLGGSCQKLYCQRCKRYFGINHNVEIFIPWDNELEETKDEIKQL